MESQRVSIRQDPGRSSLQPKLTIGAPDDQYEQEADRVADEVTRPDPAATSDRAPQHADEQRLQRACPEREKILQRLPAEGEEPAEAQDSEEFGTTSDLMSLKPLAEPHDANHRNPASSGTQLGPQTEQAVRSLHGRGQPLDKTTRTFLQQRLGHDFQHVKVHADDQAGELARQVSARAFTIGNDVVFGRGEYRPQTSEGRWLLAHELTHVVQQQGRPAALRRKKLCDCPKLKLKTPKSSEVKWLKKRFPNLDAGDWCITAMGTKKYNCYAWTVGVTSKWMGKSIDKDFGDKDGKLEISDLDALYATKGLKPAPKGKSPKDPVVALYGKGSVPLHAARKSSVSCSSVVMFESKMGPAPRIIHPVRNLEKGHYGDIIRWYVKR